MDAAAIKELVKQILESRASGRSIPDEAMLSANFEVVLQAVDAVQEWSTQRRSRCVKAAMDEKRAKRERAGKVPYGWDLLDASGSLTPNAEEQAVVARICRAHKDGVSLQEIADDLTRDGVPTKSGRNRWVHSTINRILTRIGEKGADVTKARKARASGIKYLRHFAQLRNAAIQTSEKINEQRSDQPIE